MKHIEVTLNLEVVAPLLDFIKPVIATLDHETAFAPEMAQADRELEGVWREGLIHTQVKDCRLLLALFGPEFFESGRIVFHQENSDAVLRAASAVRLKLRETALKTLDDAAIEGGEIELEKLSERERMGFASYLFLATLQEIIIKHLGV
ncbi:MAG: hypothetical protein ACREIA_19825 [Opitutaceae bacterium]